MTSWLISYNSISKQSALTQLVRWQQGHWTCKCFVCWFVVGDDLTGSLHVSQATVSEQLMIW